jgi:hypothetical protein
LDYPASHQSVDLDLKGHDALLNGATVPTGTTLAAQPDSKFQLLTTRKQNGNVVNVGTMSLSEDGRELIEEWWRPENPTLRSLLVYEKQ